MLLLFIFFFFLTLPNFRINECPDPDTVSDTYLYRPQNRGILLKFPLQITTE